MRLRDNAAPAERASDVEYGCATSGRCRRRLTLVLMFGSLISVTFPAVADTTTSDTVIKFSYDTYGHRTGEWTATASVTDTAMAFVSFAPPASKTASTIGNSVPLETDVTTTIKNGTPPYVFALTRVSGTDLGSTGCTGLTAQYGYQTIVPDAGAAQSTLATTAELKSSCPASTSFTNTGQWMITVTDADGNYISKMFAVTHTYTN